MKAKLLKTAKGHYVLVDETKETYDKGFLIGNSRETMETYDKGFLIGISRVNKLSLNNCLEIENGYDLSALFCEVDESIDYQEFDFTSFRLGFQKALEFLNKKFSEEDIRESYSRGQTNSPIQSLQQTEWDVEICCHIDDHGTGNGSEDSFSHPMFTNTGIPKLDHDGCLILKRI